MCRLKLHLLVALLTFGVGVGVVTFLNAFSTVPVRLADGPAPYSAHALLSDGGTPAHQEDSCRCATTSEDWEEMFLRITHFGKPVIHGGVLQGKAISKPQPVYPPIAKAARASGTVPVAVIVGEEGKVIAARALGGHPLLQQASVTAACQSRFSPTLLSGHPVKVSGFINYNFVLE